MTYDEENGLTDFYTNEAKFSGYSKLNFSSIYLGMRTSGKLNWLRIAYHGSSLYGVIKDNTFRNLDAVPKELWKKLINNSSLQPYCNRRGFNNDIGHARVRIGIMANQENGCGSCDSWVGFGAERNPCFVSYRGWCGNTAYCGPDNGNRDTKAFGYILVKWQWRSIETWGNLFCYFNRQEF